MSVLLYFVAPFLSAFIVMKLLDKFTVVKQGPSQAPDKKLAKEEKLADTAAQADVIQRAKRRQKEEPSFATADDTPFFAVDEDLPMARPVVSRRKAPVVHDEPALDIPATVDLTEFSIRD